MPKQGLSKQSLGYGGVFILESAKVYRLSVHCNTCEVRPCLGLVNSRCYRTPLSSIARLCSSACPSAVSGLVVTMRVNSIKRRSIRALSHVAQERGIICPSFADGHSNSAVIFVLRAPRVRAPGFHGLPRAIRFSSGVAMSGFCHPKIVALEASARSGRAIPQGLRRNDFFGSAVAPAKPPRTAARRHDSANDRVSAKTHPCNVNNFRHGVIISRKHYHGEYQ